MSTARFGAAAAAGLIGALLASQADAQSSNDAEIAALKQQLRLMEQKLDRLQRQTTANTAAAANAKAEAKVGRRECQRSLSDQGPGCTTTERSGGDHAKQPSDDLYRRRQNCVALTGRIHFDGGGYDYHPSTAATVPQRLDNGVNARRARIGVVGKFLGDWNFGLVYDLGGTSDGFAGTASIGGTPVGFLPGGGLIRPGERLSQLPGLQTLRRHDGDRRRHHGLTLHTGQCDELQRHLFMERASAALLPPTSPPAISARPSVRAGSTTCSGPALM